MGRRARVRADGAAAAAAVVLLTGSLAACGPGTPVVPTGSTPSSSATGAPGASASPTAVLVGGPVPTATTAPAPVPTVTVTETVLSVRATPAATATPRRAGTSGVVVCTGWRAPAAVDIAAVPGAGSATARFRAAGGTGVTGYRVGAASLDIVLGRDPAPIWVDVAAPKAAGCPTVTATVTGLRRGGHYELWLAAMTTTPEQLGTREELVGRSAPFVVG